MRGRQSNIVLSMKSKLPDTHTHKSLTVAASWEGMFLNCDLAVLASRDFINPCSNKQWFPSEGNSFLLEEECG